MQTAGPKFHTVYGALLKKQNNQKIRSGGWRKSEGGKGEEKRGGGKKAGRRGKVGRLAVS